MRQRNGKGHERKQAGKSIRDPGPPGSKERGNGVTSVGRRKGDRKWTDERSRRPTDVSYKTRSEGGGKGKPVRFVF